MPPERDDPWHGRTRRIRDPNPESGFGFNPSFSLVCCFALSRGLRVVRVLWRRSTNASPFTSKEAEQLQEPAARRGSVPLPAQPLDRDPSNTQRAAVRAGSYGIKMLHKLGGSREASCMSNSRYITGLVCEESRLPAHIHISHDLVNCMYRVAVSWAIAGKSGLSRNCTYHTASQTVYPLLQGNNVSLHAERNPRELRCPRGPPLTMMQTA